MLKKIKSLFIFVFVLVFCGSLVSCDINVHIDDNISSSTSSSTSSSSSNSTSTSDSSHFKSITVSKAIDIATAAGDTPTSESYYIEGKVAKITNYMYGEMYITDGSKEIYVYGVQGQDGTFFDKLEDQPDVGDKVVLYGPLQMFKNKPELKKSKLISLEHGEKAPIDLTKYPVATVAETRTKAKGSKVTLNGVVSFITKTTGNKPNGYYLIDETGSTFIYDEKSASSVKVGEKIKVIGETDSYVNPKETEAANKFNYKGALQVKNAVVLENDNGSHEFDKTWIKESTVKEMIESKDYTNLTGDIFKVNAYINKSEQAGYTNYYINDLDNETGSYVYTSNNGNDFSWLDVYDGKICTVYLSIINYKATNAKVTPRFIPVKVSLDNFVFPKKDAPAFALDYMALNQFKEVYNINPKQEMITSYSNTNLGIENVVISYTSSDTNVITFDAVNGKILLQTHNDGKSKITVKAQYENYTATREVEVSYKYIDISAAKTVKEAIDAALDTQLTIRGIVTSSLVNKSGFYVSDETGVIAIMVDEELLPEFAIGDEIVIEGKRVNKGRFDYKGNEKDVFGTSAFECTKLVANLQGNHQYSESIIVKDKKVEDLYDANIKEEYTTTIYEVKCKVVLPKDNPYAVYELQSIKDDSKSIQLYCANKDQYKILQKYVDQEVTAHITLCNWNGKNFYKGCLVAVVNGNERDIDNFNFK